LQTFIDRTDLPTDLFEANTYWPCYGTI